MAKLVDILANLVRKNFGRNVIGKSRDLSLLGLTFEEAYKTVESRDPQPSDAGDYGTEAGPQGEIIVFRVNEDGSKPSRWLTERCTADGVPF